MYETILKIIRSDKEQRTDAQQSAALQAAGNVRAAARELKQAHQLFQQMDAPEMIDHATYLIKAAELRYDCLLKEYREQYGAAAAAAVTWERAGGEK